MNKEKYANETDINNISVSNDKNVVGVPFTYNNNKRILDSKYGTIVIGQDINQKNTKIIEPLINQTIKSNESFVINDSNNKLYNKYKDELEKNGYKVININLKDNNSDSINLLQLPYELYKNGNREKSFELIDNICEYIFDSSFTNDPFWCNSAANLFKGATFYLFENDMEITLDNIRKTALELNIDDFEKYSFIYNLVSNILKAPSETKGGIISVFEQKLNLFCSSESISNKIFKSSFDLKDLSNNKVALFINSDSFITSKKIVSMIINQIYYVKKTYNDNNLNVYIDNLDELFPIKNIVDLVSDSFNGKVNINLVVFIKGYNELFNLYKKDIAETIRLFFVNVIYLYSEDIDTLEHISKLCNMNGYSSLRSLKDNEALFIIIRTLPFIANI